MCHLPRISLEIQAQDTVCSWRASIFTWDLVFQRPGTCLDIDQVRPSDLKYKSISSKTPTNHQTTVLAPWFYVHSTLVPSDWQNCHQRHQQLDSLVFERSTLARKKWCGYTTRAPSMSYWATLGQEHQYILYSWPSAILTLGRWLFVPQ